MRLKLILMVFLLSVVKLAVAIIRYEYITVKVNFHILPNSLTYIDHVIFLL